MTEIWLELLVRGGPVALIAGGAVYALYKVMMKQSEQLERQAERFAKASEETNAALTKVHEALGEVTEALRRLNGKE